MTSHFSKVLFCIAFNIGISLSYASPNQEYILVQPLEVVVQEWDPNVATVSDAAKYVYEAYSEIKQNQLPFAMAIARYHNGSSPNLRKITSSDELYDHVKSLNPGDVSQVIQVLDSFFILKVVDNIDETASK